MKILTALLHHLFGPHESCVNCGRAIAVPTIGTDVCSFECQAAATW